MAKKEMTKTVKNGVNSIMKWCDNGIVVIEKEGSYYRPCQSGSGITLATLYVFALENFAKELNVSFEEVIQMLSDIHNGGKFSIKRDENGIATGIEVE